MLFFKVVFLVCASAIINTIVLFMFIILLIIYLYNCYVELEVF